MGRRNIRGLELSFKPVRGGRGRGRWYKKFNGKTVYFGWGDGMTDRNGYQASLNVYRQWLADAESRRTKAQATGLMRHLQFDFSPDDLSHVDLVATRGRIAKLRELGPDRRPHQFL
jgi:hypothetical protein